LRATQKVADTTVLFIFGGARKLNPYIMSVGPPLLEQDTVVHIGTLNPTDKGSSSWEGLGLSVSRDPDAWESIADLGGRSWWTLQRAGGLFVSYHDLSENERESVCAWGLNKGLVERVRRYRCRYYDDELEEEHYLLFTGREEAELEAEDMESASVDVCYVVVASARMRALTGLNSADAFDHLLGLYTAEHTPHVDGIWWEDENAPTRLSAPRGLILPERIRCWCIQPYQAQSCYR
jgi:hypothetical protein